MNLGVQFINVFDQDTDTRLFQARYRDAISGVNDAQFFQGFDVAALKAANPAIRNDRGTRWPTSSWMRARFVSRRR